MKKEKTLQTKWWFWLILVVILIVISFVILVVIGNMVNKNKVRELAYEIEEIYKDATLYSSAGEKVLLLELQNYDTDTNNKQLVDILNLIKTRINNGNFEEYNKLITIAYLSKGDFIIKDVVAIPDFIKEEHMSYINFKQYETAVGNWENTLDLLK